MQPKLGDTALSQFTSFIESCVKGNPENVSAFNWNEQRIDDFYFNEMKNLCGYSDFCKILELVFVWSHGQADKEKGFSLNKNLLKQNMEPLTITSRWKIKDYILCKKIKLNTYTILSKMLEPV